MDQKDTNLLIVAVLVVGGLLLVSSTGVVTGQAWWSNWFKKPAASTPPAAINTQCDTTQCTPGDPVKGDAKCAAMNLWPADYYTELKCNTDPTTCKTYIGQKTRKAICKCINHAMTLYPPTYKIEAVCTLGDWSTATKVQTCNNGCTTTAGVASCSAAPACDGACETLGAHCGTSLTSDQVASYLAYNNVITITGDKTQQCQMYPYIKSGIKASTACTWETFRLVVNYCEPVAGPAEYKEVTDWIAGC